MAINSARKGMVENKRGTTLTANAVGKLNKEIRKNQRGRAENRAKTRKENRAGRADRVKKAVQGAGIDGEAGVAAAKKLLAMRNRADKN